ncbi:MAG: protein kinase [Kofleriaceae bacterium]
MDTIDGLDPGSQSHLGPQSHPEPATIDYPELVTVERRHYQIVGEIAKGGMGRVLEARDLRLGRDVAIKELLPRNRDAARRFEREARITARLQHPAIIHVYEAGIFAGGEPFYAMPRVSGRSLDKVVAERKTLAERLALVPNVIAVADALAYAHHQHVIHRDLKPANVLLGTFGETVVIDWGLAKDLGSPPDPVDSIARPASPVDTNVGTVVGTPVFMSPEQASGAAVDQRADVYAIGALLYYVLVGAPPYTGTSSTEVLERVKCEPCIPVHQREPGAPADLVAIVVKAMARNPADRYDNADELAHDLNRFQTGQLVAARHYTRLQLVRRWLRRYRVAVAITTVALVALASVAIFSVNRIVHEQAKDQRRRDVLLEERGRTDLLDGHPGRALAYLVAAARDGEANKARAFLIADAMRSLLAEDARFASHGAVAYTPDGDRIATIGADGTVTLWNARTAGVLATLGTSGAPARHLRFAPSGNLVVAHADFAIRIWSPGGAVIQTLTGHTDDINDLDVSADGRRIATAGNDGNAFVWSLPDGHRDRVNCEPVTDSGVINARPIPPGTAVLAARFSPDGVAAVFVLGEMSVCTWSASAANNWMPRLHTDGGRITTLRWLPGPPRLLLTASTDGQARIWDLETGKNVVESIRHGGELTTAELSPDGRLVATCGVDGLVRIWELDGETKPVLRRTLTGHRAAVEHARFDATGTQLATAGRDNTVKTWNVESGQLLATFEHSDIVRTATFSPDHSQVFSTSNDGTARLWNVARGQAQHVFEVDLDVSSLAVSRTGAVAVAGADSRIALWRSGNASEPPVLLRDHVSRVNVVAFSPSGDLLASAGEDPDTYLWEVASGRRLVALHGSDQAIRALAFHPHAPIVATAGDEGRVRLWSTTGDPVRTLEHDHPVIAIVYSPGGETLVGLDDIGRLAVWAPEQTAPVQLERPTTSPARAIAFSPDGTRLVISGSTDTIIVAVDHGRIGAELLRVDGPTEAVRAVAFTPDGSRVITGGGDGLARVWDAAKGKLVGIRDTHGGKIQAIAVAPDGNTLWSAGGNQVQSWDIHLESRTPAELDAIVRLHVPWRLDDDDVARLVTEGDSDGQR